MDGFKSTNELEDYLYKLSGEIEPKNQLPKKAVSLCYYSVYKYDIHAYIHHI